MQIAVFEHKANVSALKSTRAAIAIKRDGARGTLLETRVTLAEGRGHVSSVPVNMQRLSLAQRVAVYKANKDKNGYWTSSKAVEYAQADGLA